MTNKNDIQNLFISLIEKVANGKVNVLNFGEEDMKFYRGEIHILKKIGDLEGIYTSEMASMMGVTRAVIHKTVLKLEKKGFITKKQDDTDKKRKKLFLTEKGKKAYQLHEIYHQKYDSEFINYLENLTDRDYRVIYQFLVEAHKIIDNHF